MRRKNWTRRSWYVIDQDGRVRGEVKGGESIKTGVGCDFKSARGEFVKKNEAGAEELLRGETAAYWLLGYLTRYIEPHTNLLKNGFQKLTVEDLARFTGISRQTIGKRLATLKEYGFISTFYLNRRNYFVMNPKYFSKSAAIPKEIWRLFNDAAKSDDRSETIL